MRWIGPSCERRNLNFIASMVLCLSSGSGVAAPSAISNAFNRPKHLICMIRLAIFTAYFVLVGIPTSAFAQPLDWKRSDVPDATVAAKRALIVVSNGSHRDPTALLEDNARKYSKLLGDLGFDTLTIGSQPRPILDQSIRKSVVGVPAGAAVAVLVTGFVLARDGDLFILPVDASVEVANGQAAIDAETIRLSFLFRRLAVAAPKEIIALLDDCSATPEFSGLRARVSEIPVSVLCLRKKGDLPGAGSVNRVMSAMKEEGLNYKQFANRLRSNSTDGSLDITTSNDLSTSFYFFDPRRFESIDNLCNKIAVGASAVQARAASLAESVEACSIAVRRWPYVSGFRARHNAGLEQQVFQNSMKSCAVTKSREGYKSKYPNGRYIREATTFFDECSPVLRTKPSRSHYHLTPQPPSRANCFIFNGVRRCE
ncbi:hypothetical protein [Methylorubrum extorquens]|uniref:Caspase family p20 domain-containing protein n=1 Tax=Methylorubrum extorquens (strain CM4 / NCIMB 13688) TaxID=440085 RepID=B7KW05_METC4|nr:hypothetical protein [Methylorubrum extorquens]ACK82821.1 hypothetical protein Mchl_1967 [Methylorubrum extorquens CM4]